MALLSAHRVAEHVDTPCSAVKHVGLPGSLVARSASDSGRAYRSAGVAVLRSGSVGR